MEVKVLKNILSANDQIAARNRELLDSKGIFTINIMSSPGAGKTSLLLETIKRLKDRFKIGVIEGDISSRIDADRIAQEGVPAVQINTGGECHLDANMTGTALANMPLDKINLLFIENVGNLICPGEFQLGENKKVLISSVPEGDDKPYKYPLMFHIADVIVLNKIDLLPYVRFNMENFTKGVKALNQNAEIIQVSCVTGEGLDKWVAWLLANVTRPAR